MLFIIVTVVVNKAVVCNWRWSLFVLLLIKLLCVTVGDHCCCCCRWSCCVLLLVINVGVVGSIYIYMTIRFKLNSLFLELMLQKDKIVWGICLIIYKNFFFILANRLWDFKKIFDLLLQHWCFFSLGNVNLTEK